MKKSKEKKLKTPKKEEGIPNVDIVFFFRFFVFFIRGRRQKTSSKKKHRRIFFRFLDTHRSEVA